MSEVGSAYLSILPSLKGLKGRLESEVTPAAASAGSKAGKSMGSGMTGAFGSSIKSMIGIAAATMGAIKAGEFFSDSIAAASDLAESGSKIQAVFGPAAKSIQDFAAGGAKSLGQSTLSVLDANATFGVFGKAAGLAGQDLAKFSTGFTGLSTDLASFYNTDPSQAVEAIGAALRGEAEPIRQYGVLLDDATLRSEALRLGLIKTTKQALTPQQKVLAAQAAIYRQTKDAQGDFAKTSRGLANQQRILGAGFENLKGTIGRTFLPAVTGVVSWLNDKLLPSLGGIGDAIGPAFSGIGAKLAPAMPAISAAFDTIKGIVSGAITVIKGAWDRWGQGLIDSVRVVFSAVAGVIQPALDVIRGIIDTIGAAISGDWSGVWDGIKSILSGAWSLMTSIVGGALSIIKQILSTAWSAIASVVGTAWTGITTAVSTAVSGLVSFVAEIPGKILSALGDFGSLLASKGADLITGLMSGIASMGGRLVEWLKQWVAEHIPGPIAEFLGIASPSKVMAREVGRWIPLGIQAGIESTQGRLAASVSSLVDVPSISGPSSMGRAGTVPGGGMLSDFDITRLAAAISQVTLAAKITPAAVDQALYAGAL